jgi:lipopolysaccharide heptosyltransferase II
MMRRIIIRAGSITKRVVPLPSLGSARKICVFKIGAMGDVLMSTPMVHALRQEFPRARIDYWTGQASAQVLKNNHDLNAVIAFPDETFLKKRVTIALGLARRIAAQKYDVMFVLDKHWSLGVFGRLCRIPVRIGFDREGEGFGNTHTVGYLPVRHEIDYYLELAYLAGARRVVQPKPELPLAKEDIAFARSFFKQRGLNPQKTIGIAPGGAKNPGQDMAIRRWPLERFAAVARQLEKEGWQVLLLGRSPGDDFTVQPMLSAAPNAVNAIGAYALHQSAALMKLCKLIICNDSGPMHFAAAVGTPTVSVFGATDPNRKAPRGARHRWVWNPVDCVRAEVFAQYNEPHLINNILKVQPRHVLKAVHELVK